MSDKSEVSAFDLLSSGGRAGVPAAKTPATSAASNRDVVASSDTRTQPSGGRGTSPPPQDERGGEGAEESPTPGPSRKREGGSVLSATPHQPDDEPRSATPANGRWNKRRMAAFLRELAATQSVAAAARSVGVSRQSAYRLKNRLVATPFAFGWEVALEAGFSQLAHAMMDRAVNGVEVPHYYQGELIGTSRTYDERLSIWISANPWKIGRQQIAREYSAEGFDRLMQRIEQGPLDWGEVEFADENGEFAQREAPEVVDALPGRDPPVRSAEEAGRAQRKFVDERSWYAALVSQETAERGRKR